MRRIASVFSNKRSDKSDASAAPTRPNANLSTTLKPSKPVKRANTLDVALLTPSIPGTPQLVARSEPSYSSTCSSGSTSLRTPDDDPVVQSRLLSKKSWVSWVSSNRSGTLKGKSNKPPPSIPHWQAPPPPVIRAPPSGSRNPPLVDDSEDDTSSEDEDEESVSAAPTVSAMTGPPVTPAGIADARKTLKAILSNRAIQIDHSSPFFQRPGSPPFPRSCNSPLFLPHQQTMRMSLHNTILLRRLNDKLTSAEEASILSFSARIAPEPSNEPTRSHDEMAISDLACVSDSSQGIKRWLSRACFEERFIVWFPAEGSDDVLCRAVSGTKFGVAELEFSEAIEAQAGLHEILLESTSEQVSKATEVTETSTVAQEPQSRPNEHESQVAASAQVMAPSSSRSAYKATPSPLRMQHGPPPPQGSPAPSARSQRPPPTPTPDPTDLQTTIKRGVRFAEDDKDDHIPIGYALRIKKKREEKSKFLQDERARRELELEKAKLDAERKMREQERSEWEKERRAWEKEKKAMEDERKKRLYAEEVSAARLRQELQRAGNGGVSRESIGTSRDQLTSIASASASTSSLRDPERNRPRDSRRYSRAGHEISSSQSQSSNPRRQVSESTSRANTNSSGSSPRDGSPSSSRPASGAEQSPISTPLSGSQPSFSRPASAYSSNSSEDVIARENGMGTSHKKRLSSSLSHPSAPDRASSYPTWSSGQGYLLPAMPMVGPFVMDMPLLPPTPPFMMQQYPRPRSRGGSGSSTPAIQTTSSSSMHRLPGNNSSDRVNTQHRQQSSSPHRSDNRRSDASPSASPHKQNHGHHQRRPSGEARVPPTSRSQSDPQERGRAPPSSYSSQSRSQRGSSSGSLPRSRPSTQNSSHPPMASMYLQQPSPWSALPTASQLQAQMMAYGVGLNMNGTPATWNGRPGSERRQTAFS